jgi:hypothetical protein
LIAGPGIEAEGLTLYTIFLKRSLIPLPAKKRATRNKGGQAVEKASTVRHVQ